VRALYPQRHRVQLLAIWRQIANADMKIPRAVYTYNKHDVIPIYIRKLK
jgi:hypothetical protein